MSARDQWIFTWPCDCPVGVMEGSEARTAEKAMKEMYPGSRERVRAYDRGVTARLIPFSVYEERYFERMFPSYTCPHEGTR